MLLNRIMLVIIMMLPLDFVFAEVKNHVRDDENYYYSYHIAPNNFDYYIQNQVIKEGDYIILDGMKGSKFLYCKNNYFITKDHGYAYCLYNGVPFKKNMHASNPLKGYKIR